MKLYLTRNWMTALFQAFLMLAVSLPVAQGQYPTRTRSPARTSMESRVGTRNAASAAARAKGGTAEIRRLIGVGRQTEIKTPEYRTSIPKSTTRPRDWAQIGLTYDTAPEWIDLLTIRYFVLATMREEGKQLSSLYRKTVDYLDVKEGRSHRSAVYLHPGTVERHGVPVAVHVDLLVDGEVVDSDDDLDPSVKGKLPEDWWENRQVLENPNLTVRDGYLLSRDETPFFLINIDDYEVIK